MNKVLSLLGLARRAGKLCFHEAENLRVIRSGAAKLVILASDAGQATAKKYRDKSSYFGVPLVVAALKKELGRALGTSPRTAVVILDEEFALRVKKLLE
ncbi:MAG: 50S ribosomal protein L7ae [Firmicutes bacterium]|nr:50S ribosomal protein L7ae [Bacillota bacterium]